MAMMLTDCQCWKDLIPEYIMWGMALIGFAYIMKMVYDMFTFNLKGGKQNEESIQKE